MPSLVEEFEARQAALKAWQVTLKAKADADKIRQFSTGATRNLDKSKLDYEGFLSP